MARLAGIDLPKEKRVEIGLTYIYGIGLTSSQKILKEAGVNLYQIYRVSPISTLFSLGKSIPAKRAIYCTSKYFINYFIYFVFSSLLNIKGEMHWYKTNQ